jgi:hypothetical protein
VKTIFVSDPIHRKLKVLSAQRGITLQELANLLLSQALTVQEGAPAAAERLADARHVEIHAVKR